MHGRSVTRTLTSASPGEGLSLHVVRACVYVQMNLQQCSPDTTLVAQPAPPESAVLWKPKVYG